MKIIVRLYATSDPFGPSDFVPVFHRMIQADALPGHLLIDVADYAHVPGGPGTLLVAAEANVHADRSDGGRLAMAYVRKLPVAGAESTQATVAAILSAALTAADVIERDPDMAGRLRFDRSSFVVRFNDRLLTPNTAGAAAAVTPAVAAAAEQVLGHAVTVVRRETPPRELLELRITDRVP